MDRAAWDAATSLGIRTAGWVPQGRLAEDGVTPDGYAGLRETPSPDYAGRTTLNVRDSDATLILYRGRLTGGSEFTQTEAQRLGRPVLAVDLSATSPPEVVAKIRGWLNGLDGTRLNVAGPRASSDQDLGALAFDLLRATLAGTLDT